MHKYSALDAQASAQTLHVNKHAGMKTMHVQAGTQVSVVFVKNENFLDWRDMYKHIVVAIDGSENAMRAVEQATEIAKVSPNAKVDLVSVISIDVYSDMVYDPIEAHGDSQRELIAPAIEKLKEAGVEPEVVLMHGRPAEEIIHYLEKSDADLMVIGCRGLNALQEFAIGSVSHKVIKHAKCPVLVVK